MLSTLSPITRLPQHAALASRRFRILLIGEAVSLAHIGRPALLARWAQTAGYEVRFACGPRLASIAQDEGLDPIPLRTVSGETFYKRLRAGRFFYTREELEAYIAAERELIRAERPDLVVGDFRLTLPISCRLEQVPLISLNHAHWSPASPRPMPAPQTGIFQHLPRAASQALFAAARPLAYRFFARVLDDLRVAHGLRPLRDFRKHYTDGDACAYLDLPELAPLPWLPPGHFFLGPLVWQPERTEQETVPIRHTPANALVYVSFGSSGDTRALPDALKGVTAAGCSALVTGLSREASQRLLTHVPELARSCTFVSYVNPGKLLREARLTVCHGGAGTVYQSLAAGVPVLCIPDNPDQMLIAGSVAAQGAGACRFVRDVSAARVRQDVLRLVECPVASQRAALLGMAIQSHDTRARWLLCLKQMASRFAGSISY